MMRLPRDITCDDTELLANILNCYTLEIQFSVIGTIVDLHESVTRNIDAIKM